MVKNPPANAGDGRATGSTPGSRRRAWQEEKGMTEDEMVGCHLQFNGHEFE